jgi:nucleotide-binding universal stress UspA family protein
MRILVATGGAAHSMIALTFGTHLATVSKAALTVLTVIKREDERAQAETILERARLILNPTHAQFESLVRVGHPAEEILDEAESGQYAMVVVGEKQHHSLTTRFLLGSTALRVVEHALCPAVIVKGKTGPIKKLLICDSGANDPSVVDRLSTQLPTLLAGTREATVVHVMSQIGALPSIPGNDLAASAKELMERRAPEGQLLRRDIDLLRERGLIAAPKILRGPVVDEILSEAREGDYSLVAIGAHRSVTGWRRILLDDIAHQIVVGLDRPVLVVR